MMNIPIWIAVISLFISVISLLFCDWALPLSEQETSIMTVFVISGFVFIVSILVAMYKMALGG